MPKHKESRRPRERLADLKDLGHDIIHNVHHPALDVSDLALGLAVALVIHRADRKAFCHQRVSNVLVATAVFSKAVDDKDDSSHWERRIVGHR